MSSHKPVYALVCAGGGAHGAYQVGVLKYIHENFSSGSHSPFQIFTGASCGSLNTTFLAAESYQARTSISHLEELWLSFHVPAYHGNVVKNAFMSLYKSWGRSRHPRGAPWSFLDPKPVYDMVARGLHRDHLDRALAEGTTLGTAVAVTEIISGRTCWFQEGRTAKEWNLFHSLGIKDKLGPSHLAASCSVPVFLPPVKIGEHYFLDGSVNLFKPLSAALTMGATRILSIATERPLPMELPRYHPGFKPRFTNVIRLLLNHLSHDAAGDEAEEIEMFNRFSIALSRQARNAGSKEDLPLFHNEAKPGHYHQTEIFRFYPSKRIRDSGGVMEEGPTFEGIPRQKTRFMFHEKFIKQLINLGYEDAAARHEELKIFFIPEREKKRWFFFRRRQVA